jgi:4-diphosphocytidyl-2-C-methyl-D-erythritol kinase
MAELSVEAPAKVNLHLEVLGLRADGFHELTMVMQSIELVDVLRFNPTADARIALRCDRPDLPTDGSNLIVRAAELLRTRSGLPELGARIELCKRIPIGAGLAGGSSNAAAALVGLNAIWGLGLNTSQLQGLAAELGSDVPFCLPGGTQLCFGRGEQLESIPKHGASTLAVLLLKHPQVSVSTPWAYARCRELRSHTYLLREEEFEQRREALRQSELLAALSKGSPLPPLRNDLQAVVAPEVESVRRGLTALRQLDRALAVAMSGSGPSLLAVFSNLEQALAAQETLASDPAVEDFHSWACSFRSFGAMLEQ